MLGAMNKHPQLAAFCLAALAACSSSHRDPAPLLAGGPIGPYEGIALDGSGTLLAGGIEVYFEQDPRSLTELRNGYVSLMGTTYGRGVGTFDPDFRGTMTMDATDAITGDVIHLTGRCERGGLDGDFALDSIGMAGTFTATLVVAQ